MKQLHCDHIVKQSKMFLHKIEFNSQRIIMTAIYLFSLTKIVHVISCAYILYNSIRVFLFNRQSHQVRMTQRT